MKGYTKSDVETHRVGYGGTAYPAVNVKVQRFPHYDGSGGAYVPCDGVALVRERFGCSEETAKQALKWAWESACQDFWEWAAGDAAEHYLDRNVKTYQEGRSGGWLIVDGLPEVSEWDGVALNRWALFERALHRAVEWETGWEQVEDCILANEWAMDSDSLTRMMEEAAGGRVVPSTGTVYRRWGYGRLEMVG